MVAAFLPRFDRTGDPHFFRIRRWGRKPTIVRGARDIGVRKTAERGKRMRNYFAAAGLAAALMIPAVASGADMVNGAGVGCPEGQQGTFAFVVNQTTSTEPGTVTATFDSGEVWTVGPTQVNKKVREYYVNAHGKLLSASSTLDGKLVLDRFWCFPPA
jgi:hypothetical protein